jgi:hypothetical protein
VVVSTREEFVLCHVPLYIVVQSPKRLFFVVDHNILWYGGADTTIYSGGGGGGEIFLFYRSYGVFFFCLALPFFRKFIG